MTNATTSAALAHGELYTAPTSQTPPDPWRSWGIKLNGAYPENETLDCPHSRYFEVTVIGPGQMLVATVPEGEVTHTIEPGQTVVLREPSRLLCPIDYTNVTVREYFADDVSDERAAA